MKQIYLLLIITFFFSCLGTDQGQSRTYTYKVINKSGKFITVKSFFRNDSSIAPIITNIDVEQEIIKSETDFPPSYGETNYKRFFGVGRDSIVIFYDKEKKQSFLHICNDNKRNPLNFCIYNNLEEVFFFTEEDYNNAEDCNGNCD